MFWNETVFLWRHGWLIYCPWIRARVMLDWKNPFRIVTVKSIFDGKPRTCSDWELEKELQSGRPLRERSLKIHEEQLTLAIHEHHLAWPSQIQSPRGDSHDSKTWRGRTVNYSNPQTDKSSQLMKRSPLNARVMLEKIDSGQKHSTCFQKIPTFHNLTNELSRIVL